MSTSRRQWIQQAALSAAALGIGPAVWAEQQRTPDTGKLILLNSNENAFGPSPKTIKAIAEAASMSNRYPDDQLPDFRKKLADHWKVGTDNLALGAGATEIIALICTMLGEKKGHIITAAPSYQVWHRQAQVCGLQVHSVPLTEEKHFDLVSMIRLINADTRMLYVCNPNNPTGRVLPFASMRQQVLEASQKTLVLVDEAYNEFADVPTLAQDAIGNPNLVVIKTFSKVYGLAGARLGYAIGHPDTINKISALQGWRDVSASMVTVAAASAALDDQAFVRNCVQRTAANRETCYKTFSSLGLDYIPSQTSFILFDIGRLKGDFSERMKAQHIMVQYRDHFGGKWCRVSMGTEAEIQAFCRALKTIATT
jgi:histidinol-phosphate aminotransferase